MEEESLKEQQAKFGSLPEKDEGECIMSNYEMLARPIIGPPSLPEKVSWPTASTRLRSEEGPEERAQKREKIAAAIKVVLECIGEDPNREGLLKTPYRYADAIMFLSRGYEQSVNGKLFFKFHLSEW